MELWGNLKDFSLPDVIQLVGFGRKTGVLMVEHGGLGSRLYFAEGNVVHAVSGDTEGENAVYRLFRVDEGEFRFKAESAPERRTIFMDPTNLVMEAARLLDESTRGEDGFEKALIQESAPGREHGAQSYAPPSAPEVKVERREPPATPSEVRVLITAYLENKFGKESKRLTQAVAKCGDSIEDFQELIVRVERFVSAFVDPKSATKTGNELREILRRLPS